MLPKFEKKLNSMDESLAEMIAFLDQLDSDQLHHKSNGKWSGAQVFQHLHDSEKGTTGYLQKKLQAPPGEVPSGGIAAAIRSMLLRRALRSRKNQFTAPKVLGEIPETPNYLELKQSYLDIRKEMREILSDIDSKGSSKEYFNHPRAGRLTIGQTLGFLKDHFDRHFDQVKARTKQ
ncbi:DinB family protein [Cryomorphaceae bacterium 1068]|nr:DinB family protein [Cryomorphaceae bacterium 1068]